MFALAAWMASGALALDPRKSLTQYSRTIWTQERGLPQDTIRAITQTKDGYLWLGTDEGLARFDGYEFVVFNKTNGDLPDNSITALAAQRWRAVDRYLQRPDAIPGWPFQTFTMKQGLPDERSQHCMRITRARCGSPESILNRYQTARSPISNPIPISRDVRPGGLRGCQCDLWVAGFSRVGGARAEVRDGDAGARTPREWCADGGRPRWQHLDRWKSRDHPTIGRRHDSTVRHARGAAGFRGARPMGRS
jgi:hypothetical protein